MGAEQSEWTTDIDRAVVATLSSVAASVVPVGSAGSDLTQAIVRALEGGKRLRSTLLLTSHAAHGGGSDRAAVSLGAGLELFHTAALIHDDVLDSSETRRGRPSTHREFATLHRAERWQGDSQAFGNAGAILAGDIALMASSRALHTATSQLKEGTRDRVALIFHDMVDLVTAGQYLDMGIAAQPIESLEHQEADIRATMRSKTASYTCEGPLALGAAVAGASDDAVSRIKSIGVLMGVAFQLRDDVLGLVGSPDITGKPSGGDIREGKRTLALWYAWTRSGATERAILRRVVGKRDASDEDVAEVVAIIAACGAFDSVEEEIASSTLNVRSRIADLGLIEPFASSLDTFAASASDRDR